jgi:hypothetical protein
MEADHAVLKYMRVRDLYYTFTSLHISLVAPSTFEDCQLHNCNCLAFHCEVHK